MQNLITLVFLMVAVGTNQLIAATARAIEPQPHVVVFSGDNVVPQVVDGGGWETTFKLVNLENHTVTFTLSFIQDDGSNMLLPILGSPLLAAGVYKGISFTLSTAESATVRTAGSAAALTQGWALMQRTSSITDTIGGFAIFRQHVPGGQDQEATVPIVNQFSGHFVLLFDNTAYVSGIAIANPSVNSVSIPVTIRDESGFIIDRQFIALGPLAHTAFIVSSRWPSTAGIAGGIEFQTSGYGVGALGLRFNGSAFTTFDVLENLAWVP